MYTKESIKQAILEKRIVNLSQEDPEEVYVTKWMIEQKLLNKNQNYAKRSLTKFIDDMKIGNYIFVDNNGDIVIPFSIYEGYLFVALDPTDYYDEYVNRLIDGLKSIDYDLSSLHQENIQNVYMNNETQKSRYFLIIGVKMVSDNL